MFCLSTILYPSSIFSWWNSCCLNSSDGVVKVPFVHLAVLWSACLKPFVEFCLIDSARTAVVNHRDKTVEESLRRCPLQLRKNLVGYPFRILNVFVKKMDRCLFRYLSILLHSLHHPMSVPDAPGAVVPETLEAALFYILNESSTWCRHPMLCWHTYCYQQQHHYDNYPGFFCLKYYFFHFVCFD